MTVDLAPYLTPLTDVELATYVSSQLHVVRARRALVEVYRRLTDYATPPSVVAQIGPAIAALEEWCADTTPHFVAGGRGSDA
jgi:hypothetical protein